MQSFSLTLFQLQVNPKAAESLADPEEYSNLFDDWQVALAVESKAADTRYLYWSCLSLCACILFCFVFMCLVSF